MRDEERPKPIGASAVVTVVLEVQVEDRWGEETTAAQIFKQAKDSALNRISTALKDCRGIVCKKVDVTTVLADKR